MKKLIIIILFIISLHLSIRFILNEHLINEYNEGNYSGVEVPFLKLINYPESYIVHFNQGDLYYQKNNYSKAIEEYNISLKSAPYSKKCIIQTNIALSKLATLKYENNPNIVEELKDVEKILLDDDCAREDKYGRDDNAQELYNEIEELLQSGGKKDGDEEEEEEEQEQDSDIEEKIKEDQEQANSEREEDLNGRKSNFSYDGQRY